MEVARRLLGGSKLGGRARQWVIIVLYIWKPLWKLDALAVLKHFAWKVGNDLLPTKTNLVWHHIGTDSLCPFCLDQPETAWHILWSCPSSVAVWQDCS
jgi:hypothetical protein